MADNSRQRSVATYRYCQARLRVANNIGCAQKAGLGPYRFWLTVALYHFLNKPVHLSICPLQHVSAVEQRIATQHSSNPYTPRPLENSEKRCIVGIQTKRLVVVSYESVTLQDLARVHSVKNLCNAASYV